MKRQVDEFGMRGAVGELVAVIDGFFILKAL